MHVVCSQRPDEVDFCCYHTMILEVVHGKQFTALPTTLFCNLVVLQLRTMGTLRGRLTGVHKKCILGSWFSRSCVSSTASQLPLCSNTFLTSWELFPCVTTTLYIINVKYITAASEQAYSPSFPSGSRCDSRDTIREEHCLGRAMTR